ncbi:MAG: discoidin domain-containing protein [Oscillospiraceae bacterium]|jgi:hypothetical protein|nr:discoidin domain-containing protein [Oscillospiraceae bacterium]
MQKNKLLTIVFCAVIALALGASAFAFFQPPPVPDPVEVSVTVTVTPAPEITVVSAPDQTEPQRPDAFPDPEGDKIKLPETANLAKGAVIEAGPVTQTYVALNAVDGDPLTYWESAGLPAEITIDLGSAKAVKTVAVQLNPDSIWAARTQTFAVLGSADGAAYSEISAETKHEFNPTTGNVVRVDFDAAQARYIRLVFSSNSGTFDAGAQAGEIMVFE